MSRLRSLLIVAMAMLCGAGLAPALAQDQGPFPDITQLPGIETAVSRAYALDFSQFEIEEPGSTPIEFRDALFLAGMVLEFDAPEQAADAYQVIVDYGVEPLAAAFGIETPEIVEIPLADLGDQALAFSIFNQTASTEGFVREVVMQQEDYVFVAVIITETEESSLDADALIAVFSEQVSAAPTGVGTFDAAGGSTDGLWEFFPPADHALYTGLMIDGDDVIFPLSGS